MKFRFTLKLLLISSVLSEAEGKIIRAGIEFSADFYLIDSNARIKTNVIRTIATTESERKCIYNCIKEEDCVSFNRHKEKGTCELLDVSKFDNVSLLQRDNGWSHYETDEDQQNVGSVCMRLSPCKEYQVCEDTFIKSKPYKCRCRDGFKGLKCKTYEGPGWREDKPSTSSCRLLQMKFESFPDGDYWFKGQKNSKRCERRVDGRYGKWFYGPCNSTECGVIGTQEKNRTCDNPPPKGGGKDCKEHGKSWDIKSCEPCANYLELEMHSLVKNQRIGTIQTWPKIFQIQFLLNFKPQDIKVKNKWKSIVHFTTGKSHGARIPALFVMKTAGIMKFRLFSYLGGGQNFMIEEDLVWQFFKNAVKIDISQRLEEGRYMFRFKINDKVIRDINNNDARSFDDVTIYAGNPWDQSIPKATIKLLRVRGVKLL